MSTIEVQKYRVWDGNRRIGTITNHGLRWFASVAGGGYMSRYFNTVTEAQQWLDTEAAIVCCCFTTDDDGLVTFNELADCPKHVRA